jgi:hypothetical protein
MKWHEKPMDNENDNNEPKDRQIMSAGNINGKIISQWQ